MFSHSLNPGFRLQDFTDLIRASHPDLIGRCISNPSVVSIGGVHLLISFRIYSSWDKDVPCLNPDQPGGQWYQSWKGEGGLGLVVSACRAGPDILMHGLGLRLRTIDSEVAGSEAECSQAEAQLRGTTEKH